MDSDSSLEEERDRWKKQDNITVRPDINENSDVSDEENISRAARSIESPPESPQGTHFESPPASPEPENKPGTPSPIQSPDDSASYESPLRSPDSQMDPLSKLESSIRSPDSYVARSPSPVNFVNHSPRYEGSPIHSPSSNNESQNYIQSPSQNSPRSPSRESHSPNSVSPFRTNSASKIVENHPPRSPSRSLTSPSRDRDVKIESPGRDTPQSPTLELSAKNDDGRSNISSASSFSSLADSPDPPRPPSPPAPTQAPPVHVKAIDSHVEDLSDVSDIESMNSMSEDEQDKVQHKGNGDIGGKPRDGSKKEFEPKRKSSPTVLETDYTEQLDFEAEEKEEGECEGAVAAPKGGPATETEAVLSGEEDEGELKGEELEEGEISDEGEHRPEETEPRPVCRFYNRGQCTWGSSCRFVHPGVTDKGNYTMFEMVRPLMPVNGPPGPPMYGPGMGMGMGMAPPMPPMEPYRPMERPPMMGPMGPQMGPPMYQQPMPTRKPEEVPPSVVESAWERGLRQAKEMLRKSSKRKETEVDFEEKKMNLSLGQEELDKENDYYTRTASPILVEDSDHWGGKQEGEPKRYRDRHEEFGGEAYFARSTEQVWHQRPHYDESMRGSYTTRSSGGGGKYYTTAPSRSSREKEYYSSETRREKRSTKEKYTQREVIVQRTEKSSWKGDTRSPSPKRGDFSEGRVSGGGGGRGDEWADPWMRSKTSPLTRSKLRSHSTRKQSYSSGSSYSSSSSSRSSHSSSSSYSRSRSPSPSSHSRSRDKPRRLLKPTSPVPPTRAVLVEKKLPVERSTMMNPPPPSPHPKLKALASNPSPPSERVPSRLLAHSKAASAVAAAMRSARSRSKSSRSTSNSDSSGSSSDSSESSLSSSSSGRAVSPPPVRQKRIVIDERLALAQAMKVKAMDALKLSGQKQQIKLTLKGSLGERQAALPMIVSKKRPAESPPMDFSPPKVGGKTTPKKAPPSRREELLKQLKAVEDAIARKRSKIS